MIKYDIQRDERIVKGDKVLIMSEITSLLHILYKAEFFSKEDLAEILRLATLSEEEVHKESMQVIKDTLMKAADGDKEADALIRKFLGIGD